MGVRPGRENTICDCCVIPMKNLLRQFAGQEIVIATPSGEFASPLPQNPFVEEFLIQFSSGDVFPICQIIIVSPISPFQLPTIILDPIEMSTGECRCCEDPVTQFMENHIGETVRITTLARQGSEGPLFILTGQIEDVGEGIIRLLSEGDTFFISLCQVTRLSLIN